MKTVIDYAGGVPSAVEVKRLSHIGAVRYLSDDRTRGSLPAKPIKKNEIDDYAANGLDLAFVWQFGKKKDSDVLRGRAGGLVDAREADRRLNELGMAGWPVFFAVDFDITLAQWNTVAVEYFRAAVEVLGRARVGIYGHSRVCDWAVEDGVVADLGDGKSLLWQTAAWSRGVIHSRAVLYQNPGNRMVGSVPVDINDVLHLYWGQRPPSYRDQKVLVQPEQTRVPNQVTTALQPNPNWRGDPTFLPELFRLWGIPFIEVDGWLGRGQGDFDDIWGVMCHHTAGSNTPTSIITHGYAGLRGLLSQIHLPKDGVARLCGVGIAFHAGLSDGRILPGYVQRRSGGSMKGFTAGNARIIGIEANNAGDGKDPWPEVQMRTYKLICAALVWFFQWPIDRVVGHKEYSPSRKIDPTFNMDEFRKDVLNLVHNPPFKGDFLMALSDAEQARLVADVKEIRNQLRGLDDKGWEQLGFNDKGQALSLVDGVSALRKDVQLLTAFFAEKENMTVQQLKDQLEKLAGQNESTAKS